MSVRIHAQLSAGETIPTDSSIKYDVPRVERLVEVGCFRVQQTCFDRANGLELSGSACAGNEIRSGLAPAEWGEAKAMMSKTIKVPGPDHPITVERNPCRVIVMLGGKVIADSADALTLREVSYPPVQYIPRRDVDMAALTRTDHSTHCPYKGNASYYSIPAGGARSVNAVWSYEEPYEAVAAIRGYVAFYPDRVDSIEERAG